MAAAKLWSEEGKGVWPSEGGVQSGWYMSLCSNSPAHKVPDDVGMTDHYFGAVLLLSGRGPVEVLAEGSLDPWAVTEELLKEREVEIYFSCGYKAMDF